MASLFVETASRACESNGESDVSYDKLNEESVWNVAILFLLQDKYQSSILKSMKYNIPYIQEVP